MRPERNGPASAVNLIDDRSITTALLLDPLAWRVRVVEQLRLVSGTGCIRRRSLQCAPLRSLVQPREVSWKGATEATLVLNVAPVPRGPLLDFDVWGPLGSAWLLPRHEIATRQTDYLISLAHSAGISVGRDEQRLLEAMLGFAEGSWVRHVSSFSLPEYLRDGLGRAVAGPVVERLQLLSRRCGEILRPRIDTRRDENSVENPALVLPALFEDGAIQNDAQATVMVEKLVQLLETASRASNSSAPTGADDFLNSLADYGAHYDLMAAMKVPLDEPFLIKYQERRNLDLTPLTNRGYQELVIADAQTNHVALTIGDPNVRIARFEAKRPSGQAYSYGAFLSREDEQTRAFYAYDFDRDYRARLEFRLALLRRLQFVPYLVAAILLLLSAALLAEEVRDLRSLALLVGPSALAASVLLAREPSTLGSRLRMASTIAVGLALVVVLLVATWLYLGLGMSEGASSLRP